MRDWSSDVCSSDLTPAISFELAYDKIDYGDRNPAGFRNGDDNAIRFRTFVKF